MDLYVVTHGNQSNPSVGDYVKPHGYSQILTAVAAAKDFMKGRGGEHAFEEGTYQQDYQGSAR